MTIDDAIDDLKQRDASYRCTELVQLLEDFGFTVKPTSNGRHHVIKHSQLTAYGFRSANFDGGHGANAQVKKVYVRKMARLLKQYKEGLKEIGYE